MEDIKNNARCQTVLIQKLEKLRAKYQILVVTATVLDAKIGKLENKIPVVNGLLKKTDHDTKIPDIKNISYYF